MQVTIEPKALKRMVALSGKTINARHTNPLLQNVLTDWNGHGFRMRATDLEVSIQVTDSTAKAAGSGVALFPGKILKETSKAAGKECVSLRLNDDGLEIESKAGVSSVHLSDSDFFPAFPNESNAVHKFTCRGFTFRRALDRAMHTIAKGRGRYALNGVFLKPVGEANCGEFCGTDGRRLVVSRFETQSPIPGTIAEGRIYNNPVIIPLRGCELIVAALDGMDEDQIITVGWDDSRNEIHVVAPGLHVSSALIDGQYPEYWSVIPDRECASVLTVNRALLLDTVKAAMKFTSVESSTIRLTLESGKLTIESKATGTGSFSKTIQIGYDGPEAKFGTDPSYLKIGLERFTEETITIHYRNDQTGFIVHEGDPETFFYLQMPLEA